MRSNFFINRIFKNDLISSCLRALNHFASHVHNRTGRSPGLRLKCTANSLCSEGGLCPGIQHLGNSVNSIHCDRKRVLPINKNPMCGKELFQFMNENKKLHH